MKTVIYEEFHREKMKTQKMLEERTCVPGISNKIWLVNMHDEEEAIHLGINIAATGTIEPLEASRFAHCIEEASDLAKKFKYNGYMIKY